jgi:aspartyl-tRNA(Asn)/glutamyl-tRNA(Gln) amidotransferase subunit A
MGVLNAAWELGIAQAALLLDLRELAPSELVASVLTRIEEVEPLLHAFVSVDAEGALRAARVQDGKSGGPLHGIPIAIKDIFDITGYVTGCGSQAYTHAAAATSDAAAVAALRAAGAIVIGKTATHELACGVYTPPTRNPWDLERSAGGSSGGSGAAVAAGCALAALGSDTGGSIRIPASHCGLVGVKPTYDLVSRAGALALAWSLDHVGPLSRSVEDAALLLAALTGTAARPLVGEVSGLRVGVLRCPPFAPLEPDVAAAVADAVAILDAAGCAVEDVAVPALEKSLSAEFAIVAAEAASYHETRLKQVPERIGDDVRGLLEWGLLLPASTYLRAQRTRHAMQDAVAATFAEHSLDALLAPTVPAAAQRADQDEYDFDGRSESVIEALVRTTAPFNLVGMPTVAVPVGLGAAGMPTSVQVAARPLDEQMALRLALAIERGVRPLGRPRGLELALGNNV